MGRTRSPVTFESPRQLPLASDVAGLLLCACARSSIKSPWKSFQARPRRHLIAGTRRSGTQEQQSDGMMHSAPVAGDECNRLLVKLQRGGVRLSLSREAPFQAACRRGVRQLLTNFRLGFQFPAKLGSDGGHRLGSSSTGDFRGRARYIPQHTKGTQTELEAERKNATGFPRFFTGFSGDVSGGSSAEMGESSGTAKINKIQKQLRGHEHSRQNS